MRLRPHTKSKVLIGVRHSKQVILPVSTHRSPKSSIMTLRRRVNHAALI